VKYELSHHTRFEMQRRDVHETEVVMALRNPGQAVPSRKGRQVFQSKVGAGGGKLLRVVVKEEAGVYHVVTVYKTSKVAKYWRQP